MATGLAFRRATAGTSGVYAPRFSGRTRFLYIGAREQQLLSSAPTDVQREVEQRILEIREVELMATPEEVLQGMAVSIFFNWLRRRLKSRRGR